MKYKQVEFSLNQGIKAYNVPSAVKDLLDQIYRKADEALREFSARDRLDKAALESLALSTRSLSRKGASGYTGRISARRIKKHLKKKRNEDWKEMQDLKKQAALVISKYQFFAKNA